MKVLHISEYIKGGVATVLQELVDSQKELLTVYVLINEEHAEYIQHDNLKTYNGKRSILGLLSISIAIIKNYFKFKPDIVHLHSSFAGFIGRIVLLPFNVKIIYHPHGVSFDSARVTGLKRTLLSFIELLLSYKASAIVAISDYELVELSKVLPTKKLHLINNGVRDIPYYKPNYKRNNRLLFVGRFDEQKGLDLLLEYYKTTNDSLPLDIVGCAVLSGSQLNENIDNVKFLGWRSSFELQDIFSEYSAVVMPSRWEGFGLVAIEGLRSGTPIIASNQGALSDIISEGVNGFTFDIKNFENTFRAQLSAFQKSDYSILSDSARSSYTANYTAQKMCQNVFQLYETVQ